MSEPASISAGIAHRYATAVFEIVNGNGRLERLEADIAKLRTALADSADLRRLLDSPIFSRDQQASAIGAIGNQMKLMPAMRNALGLMASKRRLFVVPQMVEHLAAMIAEHKGEVTAEVRSAKALSDAQRDKLAETLQSAIGKTVTINATVDESLIGGLVIKVGSKMIDTSISAKLSSLQNAMKEVG